MRPGTFAGVGLLAKTVLFGKASTAYHRNGAN